MNEHGYDEIDPGLEERARSLLTAAGETVPVPSGPVSGHTPRSLWPWLVAVAAVAVLLLGVPVLLGDAPDRRPPPGPAPAGEVTVPQTLWMTEAQANRTLQAAGLQVDRMWDDTCDVPEGRVTATDPAPTTKLEKGSSVLVRISRTPPAAFCAYPRSERVALGLLDLARFGDTPLEFAPEVNVYVNGELTTTLPVDAASDPDSWGDPSPLTQLVSALDQVHSVQGRGPVSPSVSTMTDSGGQYACGVNDPAPGLADRPSLLIVVEDVLDGPVGACRWFRVYRDTAGRIDAVTSAESPGTDLSAPSAAEGPAEPTADQQAVAEKFAAYARGGEPPAFTSEVRLLLGSEVVRTVSAEEAVDRDTWQLPCGTYGEASCPIDAFLPLRGDESYAVTGTVVREYSACHEIVGELPADLTESTGLVRSVSISAPEPEMCMQNWEIQLWYDDRQRIHAANFIGGMP